MLDLSIRNKIIGALIVIVLFTAVVLSTVVQRTAKEVIESRLLNSELPSIVRMITAQIDKDTSMMQSVAHQIATDAHILDWIEKGQPQQQEAILVRKLRDVTREFGLSAASFANRETAAYWNQDGFLRILQRNQEDNWFYRYRDSGEQTSSSIYVYPDGKRVELFVNYQQVNGIGLSGVAKSFEDVANMLDNYTIEQTGFVFLVDDKGQVKLHNNRSLVNSATLADIYGASATALMQPADFNLSETIINDEKRILASAKIPSIGWYVVAEVPQQEIFADINEANSRIILLTVVFVVIAAGLALAVTIPITRPIEQLVETVQDLGRGEANLSRRLKETGQKELRQVAQGFNAFLSNLSQTMEQVSSYSDELKRVSDVVKLESEKALSNSEHHYHQTSEVADSVSQMDAAVTEVAQNASAAAQTANVALDNTEQVKNTMTLTQEQIQTLVTQIGDINQVLTSLDKGTSEINQVLDVINSISEQTNLLALNAAIEAARAGEHGRGFAVVADEVRQLAQRTSDSIADIQKIIESLTQNSSAAISHIGDLVEQSQTSTDSIAQAQAALALNNEEINKINDISHLVAAATEEQSSTINTVNDNISNLDHNAESNQQVANKIAITSQELAQLAQAMNDLVDRFTHE